MTVEAYDRQSKQMVNLRASDCDFGYRTSRFKTTDKGRFFITALTFFLTIDNPSLPYYDSVRHYFEEHGITEVTPQVMRDAVVAIRRAKLPDPAVVANNGSFFANPIVPQETFQTIFAQYPEVVFWSMAENQVKLSAAWLIEQAGFKDVHDPETGMGTWPKQPLVLINEKAESTAQLLAFRQKIMDAVQAKFGVTLTQEPELLP
jgi:UDP-N-acetylmuramate dehydrogenase